jgi:uncharacterized protein (DUF2252 family)
MVFDINDFDESLPGPWEWDVKRLVTSFEIAARASGFDTPERAGIVEGTARAYRTGMHRYAAMTNLGAPASAMKRYQKSLAKARSKDSLRALAKLTAAVDGRRRIVSDPPLIMRMEDVAPGAEAEKMLDLLRLWFRGYRQSLQPDRRLLLESFEVKAMARKVVGVGSVGTRCWIAYMQGRDEHDPLFLQIKEAEASVLEPYAGKSKFRNHGQRVVEGQRLTQSASDIFLGWDRATDLTGAARDFYVRQLWDGKMSPQIELMEPEILEAFGEMCGSTLARAHARSGDRIAIASYLGTGAVFDRALTRFAVAYADQNDRDYDTVVAAIAAGELEADASELRR